MSYKLIATALINKLFRYAIASLCAFLLAKGYADAELTGALGEKLSAMIPEITGLLLVLGWDIWAHIMKLSFIAKAQNAVGMTPTGKPTERAIEAIKTIAAESGITPSIPTPGAVPPVSVLLFFLALGLALSACAGPSNSPFTSASAPEPGKVPVHVVASANASTSADNSPTYSGGVQVVFGSQVPLSARQRLLRALGLDYSPIATAAK